MWGERIQFLEVLLMPISPPILSLVAAMKQGHSFIGSTNKECVYHVLRMILNEKTEVVTNSDSRSS